MWFPVLLLAVLQVVSAAKLMRCGTAQPPQSFIDYHGNQAAKESHALGNLSNSTASSSQAKYNINTYAHIIASDKTVANGYIADQTVFSQIAVLNKAYASMGFSFVLRGVGRTLNSSWRSITYQGSAELAMKSSLRQGTYQDLNIYFTTIAPDANGEQAIGYATFPNTPITTQVKELDGLVVDPGTVPGGALAPYNLGITAVHEIGHWIGLFHPFQPPYYPPPPQGGCIGAGDMVWDTPAEQSAAFGCQVGRDTCKGNATSVNGPDMVHNYMDYSDDSCLTLFTPGQMTRAQGLFQQLRLGK